MIKAILACDKRGGVSKEGSIPWPKNTKDLSWFKKNTPNHVVVMGSKTWIDPLMPWPPANRINLLAPPEKKSFLEQINIFLETSIKIEKP
jgi:Dihydrofolate reductase